jgi:hypothetical protein
LPNRSTTYGRRLTVGKVYARKFFSLKRTWLIALSMPVGNLTFTIHQLKIHKVATLDPSMNALSEGAGTTSEHLPISAKFIDLS